MLNGSRASLPDGEVYRSCQNGQFPKKSCSRIETEMMTKISLVGRPSVRKVKCVRDNMSLLFTFILTPGGDFKYR